MNSVFNIFFSPTGTTEKIGKNISRSFEDSNIKQINLTSTDEHDFSLSSKDVAIIGIPVHRGCLPEIALERLKHINGNGTPCVIYVLYGNRDYGTALLELKQLVSTQRFIPIAEGTFIGEHSFSSSIYPIAKDRPDEHDLNKAVEFGKIVYEHLQNNNLFSPHFDYQATIERKNALRIPPDIEPDQCDFCGKCVTACPVDAIKITNNNIYTCKDKCITCMACLKTCPNKARSVKDETLLGVVQKLYESTKTRKEPEYKILI